MPQPVSTTSHRLSHRFARCAIVFGSIVLASLVTAACEGPEGPAGPSGSTGEQGPTGPSVGLDPDLSTLDKTLAGVGGADAVAAMTSFSYSSEGLSFIVREGFDPEGGSVSTGSYELEAVHDLSAEGLRLAYDRQYLFIPASLSATEVIKDNLGAVEGSDSLFGQPARPLGSDRVAAIWREQYMLHPHYLVAMAVADADAISETGTAFVEGAVHEFFRIGTGLTAFTVFIRPSDGQIVKVSTMDSDPLRRDIAVEAFYADWQADDSGVAFPNTVFIISDGELVRQETRKGVAVNGTVAADAFTFDDGGTFDQDSYDRGLRRHQFHRQFTALGIPQEGLNDQITAVPLDSAEAATATVFHLTGGSHHSLAVKQANGVVIAEAPQYPERSQAILDWVEEQFGDGTEVTHVIPTHHHVDHAGGLREFVAAGAIVVVNENVRSFYANQVFNAPSLVEPDTLQGAPAGPTFLGVKDGDVLTLPDEVNPVSVYPIISSHAKDMVVIVDETTSTLFVSDIYSPGNPPNPVGAAELLAAIEDSTRPIAAVNIAGGHGGRDTVDDLRDIVRPPPAP